MTQEDIKTFAREYSNVSKEEQAQAEKVIEAGHTSDFYVGVMVGLKLMATFAKDKVERRSVAVLMARAAMLFESVS